MLRETENWRTGRPFYGLGVCEPQVPECWWVGPVPVPCVPCNAFFPPKKKTHLEQMRPKNTFALEFSLKSSLSKMEHVVRAVVCWIAIRRFETLEGGWCWKKRMSMLACLSCFGLEMMLWCSLQCVCYIVCYTVFFVVSLLRFGARGVPVPQCHVSRWKICALAAVYLLSICMHRLHALFNQTKILKT